MLWSTVKLWPRVAMWSTRRSRDACRVGVDKGCLARSALRRILARRLPRWLTASGRQ